MEVKVKPPEPHQFAAVICAVSVIASVFTGIAFIGALFPVMVKWLFVMSIISATSALLVGVFMAGSGPEKKNQSPKG